ncbi:nuclease [Pedobacter sp. Leaf216]|uniref:thermonuclease family protein n=1 Tax=Pedobacter sp. Leaf216 TaxID=1735684 RepID=UPI0006FB0560|nr:thermonuclease family protein [Pedobacter sp. Leaf216]KQM79041.1 nuclease [Pedobacter sp. Leaf216]
MRLGKGKLSVLFLLLTLQSCFIQPGGSKPRKYSNLVFTAKVIRILDGDTMEVLYQNQPLKIRLAHIDCPEKRGKQPFGNQAKKALSDLCFGQMVNVQSQKYDRYRRLIAVVINRKKQVVNQEMIKQGMAWHFKKYSSDSLYAQLEITARKNKIGLWQEQNAIAPWAWRESKHSLSK